jgi:hypothetical protein
MGHLALILLVAALSACGNVAIGPVDHSCANRPSSYGQDGSGCGGAGGR